jgi:hypothetical protein
MGLRARSDGTAITELSNVRRIMPFLMPTANGAYVLFEQMIDHAPARRLLEALNARRPADRPITLFHLVLRTMGMGFATYPRLNRFVAGSRLYARRGIWLSFSAKKSLDLDASIFTQKMRFEPEEPLEAMVDRIYDGLREGRSDRESTTDKEIKFFLRLPAPLLRLGVRIVRWLDGYNLLPQRFIENDPMYASIFAANLGSVGLDAGFHHLYEYGSIPIFVVLGRIHSVPVVLSDGTVGAREVFVLRYTYDERVEDGFYAGRCLDQMKHWLENPEQLLGARAPAAGEPVRAAARA